MRKILKLIDFGFSARKPRLPGLSTLVFGAEVKRLMLGEGPEELKGCLGTLGYLAPEVFSLQSSLISSWQVVCSLASEEVYDEKCDIWSLGIVFLEMLSPSEHVKSWPRPRWSQVACPSSSARPAAARATRKRWSCGTSATSPTRPGPPEGATLRMAH